MPYRREISGLGAAHFRAGVAHDGQAADADPDADFLPSPLLLGHRYGSGDYSTYLDDRDDARLWAIVSREIPGISPQDWQNALEPARAAWLTLCLERREEAEGGITADDGASEPEPAVVEAAPVAPSKGKSVAEIAERLKELYKRGEKWRSMTAFGKLFGCSGSQVHEAVHSDPALEAWAKRQKVGAPKAQSINEFVTDRAAQKKELDPADDAAIREYIENADDPMTKAWFLSQSTEDQLSYLDDPDQHPTILGRRA